MMFWAPHALAEVKAGRVKMPARESQDNEHCINPPEAHKTV